MEVKIGSLRGITKLKKINIPYTLSITYQKIKIKWHTDPLKTHKPCCKGMLHRVQKYKNQENHVPSTVVDKLGEGMLVDLPEVPPAPVTFVKTRRLSQKSKWNVNKTWDSNHEELNNGPCKFGYSPHILPMWPLIVNDLIEDSLTFGTRHKLRIERQ